MSTHSLSGKKLHGFFEENLSIIPGQVYQKRILKQSVQINHPHDAVNHPCNTGRISQASELRF